MANEELKKHLIITAVMFLISLLSFGQASYVLNNNSLANRKPVVGSPNAAAIEKFIEFPAANYTGVPDISIPVFEVKVKGFSMPIALSYHASGIKVDEISTEVGLGWALTGGGVINILSNGLLDEVYGYPSNNLYNFNKIKTNSLNSGFVGGEIDCATALIYADPLLSDPYQLYSGQDIDLLKDVVNETADSEPDLYTFNYGGTSGKFFADENGVFRTIPYSEKKIERIIENNLPAGYKITDENGNIFEFRLRGGSSDIITDPSDPYHSVTRESRSYYLTKITTTEGEIITLTYTSFPFSMLEQKSETRTRAYILSSCWQLNSNGSYFSVDYNYTNRWQSNTCLQTISSSSGALVNFVYSTEDRLDLPSQAHAKYLDKIEIWNQFPVLKKINEFALSHNYFGFSQTGNSNDCRLKLTAVTENGKPATQIIYNPLDPPARLSLAQDHYGYYNARNNINTLLPLDEYNEFWEGSDRIIDPNFTQAGMLTKMIHPTGGSTEFIYEPNEYWTEDITTIYPKVIGGYLASFPDQTVSTTITIPSNARKIRLNYTNSYDGTVIHNDYCIIHLTGPNNFSQNFLGNSNLNTLPISLEPGQYTLSIENVGATYSADVAIYWFEETQIQPHNEAGGGLRIKEINKYDESGGLALNRKYEYRKPGTNKSSGVFTFAPSYITYIERPINQQQSIISNNATCQSYNCPLIAQNSNSVSPLIFANGSPVLYTDVTIYERTKTEAGYTEYKYNVARNGFNTGPPALPYAPRIYFDWTSGVLLEKKEYGYLNNQFTLLSKTVNTYNYNEFDPDVNTTLLYKMYGAKIAVQNAPFICWGPCSSEHPPLATFFSPISFGIQYYKFYSSWHRLEKTEETVYNNADANFLTTTTNYFFDNLNTIKPTRVEMTNSKGENIRQIFKYPIDFSTTVPYGEMLNRNMIAPLIEQTSVNVTLGNKELSKVKTNYQFWHNNTLIEPSIVQKSFLGNPLETETVINDYDNKGNILQITQKNAPVISYVWDYYQQYPIAEITNSDNNSVAYTSFEADGTGNWLGIQPPNIQSDPNSLTGKKNYQLSGTTLSKTVTNGLSYIISYWSKNGSYTINGGNTQSLKQGKTVTINGNSWTYYEHQVSATTTQLSVFGNGNIDELRLYPSSARMTTYTYEPLIGITSQCDINNRITYYEYDNFNRLILVRDQDKNIIKRYCYNYAGQPENCLICTDVNPNWQNTATATRCKSGTTTGEIEQEQIDVNVCSSTYNQTRWVVVSTNCTTCPAPANWQNTATATRCKAGTTTGEIEQEQQDVNTCSSTYNQTRWVVIGTNCTTCPAPANWQSTATATRCKAVTTTGEIEQEQRDVNVCSSTYNQTRWVVVGTNCTTCPAPANWQNTATATRCKAGTTTGEIEQEQIDVNVCSSTYNQTRWVVVSTNCTTCPAPANWQNTATATRCKSGSTTGEIEQEQKDINVCSSTYNQIRWVVVSTNCTTCPAPANWQNTATATRCKAGTTTGQIEQEQRDVNVCSSTYNQTRWVVVSTNCTTCPAPANWQNTTTPLRCQKDGSNQNTGYQEQEQRDVNVCSSTYNQTRWVVAGYNTTACPLPYVCSSQNCSGIDQRCVGGYCEWGIQVYTNSYYDSYSGMWVCVYHYEWSDGFWSIDYYDYGYSTCFVQQ